MGGWIGLRAKGEREKRDEREEMKRRLRFNEETAVRAESGGGGGVV